MPCLLTFIGLIFPRFLIIVLWLFTHWFSGVFQQAIWPVLGFLFFPVTTLWYSVVINNYGGHWSGTNILLMVLAVVIDMGTTRSGYKTRRK
jgi:hypothetical protein